MPTVGEQMRQADEAFLEYVRCMQDRGWNLGPDDDGGWTESFPVEQTEVHDADREECLEESGRADIEITYTEEEASALYDTLLEIADCLRELGYPVPDPPSRQQYIERALDTSSQEVPWHPYHIAATEFGAYGEVQAECPIPAPP